MSKYNAQKTTVDGITYDSRKEAQRAQELRLMLKAGIISNLREQVPYELIPAQKNEYGKVIERAVIYKADFVYDDEKGKTIVEDTKGVRTKEYIIKRKLMLYEYGIRISEV
jgi:hypothetical protein